MSKDHQVYAHGRKALGHYDYYVKCSCGWQSNTWPCEDDAQSEWDNHAGNV
jgi:hypothetical protein